MNSLHAMAISNSLKQNFDSPFQGNITEKPKLRSRPLPRIHTNDRVKMYKFMCTVSTHVFTDVSKQKDGHLSMCRLASSMAMFMVAWS